MALAMLALTLWGFASTFYLRDFGSPDLGSYLDPPPQPIRWLYIVHGTVFTAWVVLLVVQAWLVGSTRLALHKAIGKQAYWLYGLVVATGLGATVYAAIHGYHVPVDRHIFSALPFLSVSLFAILAWIGLGERRDVQRHKRLMLMATAIILAAAGGRILVIMRYLPQPLSLILLFPIALAIWDCATLGRIHPTTLKAGSAVILVQLMAIPIGSTALWRSATTALFG